MENKIPNLVPLAAALRTLVWELKYTGRLFETAERTLLKIVLQEAGGNQVEAAKMLRWNRNTLKRRCEALGIDVKGFKPTRAPKEKGDG